MGLEAPDIVNSPENAEDVMHRYVYFDTTVKSRKAIFECEAPDMFDADRQFIEKMGRRPDRDGSVGMLTL